MSNNPRWPTWRQSIHFAALWVSWAVGILFGMVGENPFDPAHLWGKNSQNVPFLWVSTIFCLVAAGLSYTLWPQVRAETTRKDLPESQEPPSRRYENGNMIRSSWLVYMVFIPGLCIAWILGNLATITHLEMFSWLGDVVLLVAIATDIVVVVLLIKGARQRARARKREQPAHL